jgi:hypothetical protein
MFTKGPTRKIQIAGLYSKQIIDIGYYTRIDINIMFYIKQ